MVFVVFGSALHAVKLFVCIDASFNIAKVGSSITSVTIALDFVLKNP